MWFDRCVVQQAVAQRHRPWHRPSSSAVILLEFLHYLHKKLKCTALLDAEICPNNTTELRLHLNPVANHIVSVFEMIARAAYHGASVSSGVRDRRADLKEGALAGDVANVNVSIIIITESRDRVVCLSGRWSLLRKPLRFEKPTKM